MSKFGFPVEPPPEFTKLALPSLVEAQTRASFPAKLPAAIPAGYRLATFDHVWPPHIDAAGRTRKIHADYTLTKYVEPGGATLQVVQGFCDLYFVWTLLNPPSDSYGVVDINGRSGAWTTANPAAGEVPQRVNNRYVIANWERNTDFAYVGWQDGNHPAPQGGRGDSPRFYGLAADKLTVDQLLAIARSVPVTAFTQP